MIIRSMTANFGSLEGRSIAFEDGLNIITAPNESGKSTWCAFLRTMLYGLDTAAREKQGEKPDRVKYAPWSRTTMSGSMDLEYEGRAITVRRWTEKPNAPMQAFSVTYTGTDEPVPGLTADNLGETLTGVSRGVFERSAFIRQSGLAMSNSEELEKHVSALLSGGEEGLSYTEVSKKLALWQRHRKAGGRGERGELEEQLTENEDRLRQLRQAGAETEALDSRIEEVKAQRTQAVRRMENARAQQRRRTLETMMAGRKRVQNAEAACTQAQNELQAREKALAETSFAGLAPEEAEKRTQAIKRRAQGLEAMASRVPPLWICLVLAVLCLAALGMSFVLAEQRIVFWAAAAVLGALCVLSAVRRSGKKKKAARLREERQALLSRAGVSEETELDGVLGQYGALWEKKEQARKQTDTLRKQLALERQRQQKIEAALVQGLDFSKGESEAAQAGREVKRLEEELEQLKEQRARTAGKAGALGDPMAIRSEVSVQKAKLDELDEQYDAIGLAMEVMAEADGELQSRFSPELSRRAAEYFADLTGGRYDEITLSRELNAKARVSGEAVGRESVYLSEGTADQLYLALRLAVCEMAMPEGKSCPMVLDDALVNFDGERMARALERIAQTAQSRQILLFTCHEREAAHFAHDPAVNKISAGL